MKSVNIYNPSEYGMMPIKYSKTKKKQIQITVNTSFGYFISLGDDQTSEFDSSDLMYEMLHLIREFVALDLYDDQTLHDYVGISKIHCPYTVSY